MIAVDLSKQQVPDANPIEILQINFNGILYQAGNTIFFYHWIGKRKKVIFFTRNCEISVNVFQNLFIFTIKSLSIAHSQLNKLQSGIKNGTKVTFNSFLK